MKTQLYYALLDIGSEWRKIIKFIFQMLLSLLAFMYIVSSIFQQLGFSQWLQGKADYEHTYMLYDAETADVERFIPEGEERESLAQEFYRWIREDSGAVRTYSVFDYNLPIKDERLDASLSVGKDEGALLYHFVFVDEGFLNEFSLGVSSGETFMPSDYMAGVMLIPALMGADFAKKVEVGDCLAGMLSVKGILKNDSHYIQPSWTNELMSLDKSIILPIQYAGNADANDIYMATFGTCVVSEGEACLDRIVEHARKLKLYDIEYRTIGEQKDLIESGLRWELSIEVVLLFVIICSCMTCAITRLQTFVEQHAREFSIHLFCGAQNKEIMLRLILQMFVPATFAFGLAALIYAYVGRLSIMIVACAALANLVIITGILLLPLLRFKKKSINILLKRSE